MWSKVIRPGVGVYLAIALPLALGRANQAQQTSKAVNSATRTYVHAYVNHEYGYQIQVPEGLAAVGTSPPNPNHGVKIQLTDSKSYVWVDASYTDATSLSESAQEISSGLAELCGGTIKNVSHIDAKLADLRSVRLTYECGGKLAFVDVVAAIRLAKGRSTILYQVGLFEDNSSGNRLSNVQALNNTLSQFKLLPLD